METGERRAGGGVGHVQSDPGGPERLANKLHARPLGGTERKPSLPLPLSDDTSQLRTGISLPTKPLDRLTKCFKGQL